MKLVVESEISATRYKKIMARIRHFSKTKLLDLLDHYIFHVMTDADIDELLKILDEKENSGEQSPIAASAIDDDLFFAIDPKERFRPSVIATVPLDEDLNKFKDQLELLYDQNCFEYYIHPEIRADVARKLISFAVESNIPVLDHWKEFSEE